MYANEQTNMFRLYQKGNIGRNRAYKREGKDNNENKKEGYYIDWLRERERDRETDRQTERERQRQRERDFWWY